MMVDFNCCHYPCIGSVAFKIEKRYRHRHFAGGSIIAAVKSVFEMFIAF